MSSVESGLIMGRQSLEASVIQDEVDGFRRTWSGTAREYLGRQVIWFYYALKGGCKEHECLGDGCNLALWLCPRVTTPAQKAGDYDGVRWTGCPLHRLLADGSPDDRSNCRFLVLPKYIDINVVSNIGQAAVGTPAWVTMFRVARANLQEAVEEMFPFLQEPRWVRRVADYLSRVFRGLRPPR